MVKNLVSMHKFTVVNYVSVTFYPFGYTRKDCKTGDSIERCDSVSDLYPIVLFPTPSLSVTTCVGVSIPTWHQRIGHLGTFFL